MQRTTYGLRAVRLTEVPLDERMKGARRAAKSSCRDGVEAAEVLAAALAPSDTKYWVPRHAADELLAA